MDIIDISFDVEITSVELLQTVLKLYSNFVLNEFERDKNFALLDELFNCRMNQLKLKFNYEKINKHIPKAQEYFSERHVTKLVDQMYDHLLGMIMASFFDEIPS